MTFNSGNNLPGGKRDKERLYILFMKLGFDVKVHENLKANDMLRKIKYYSKLRHTGVFCLIILSHGKCNEVLGTDRKSVKICQLESFFYSSNCPSLCSVPKIFVIDACRGSRREKFNDIVDKQGLSIAIPKTAGSDYAVWSQSGSHLERDPRADTSDFIIIYASTYGNVAYADSVEGSHLTQTFVTVIEKANRDRTLLDMLTMVKHKIQKSKVRQTVEVVDRLTKQYFIKR